VPATTLVIFEERLMTGEHAPEARVGKAPRPLVGRHGLGSRLKNKSRIVAVVYRRAAHAPRLRQALRLGKLASRVLCELGAAACGGIDGECNQLVEHLLAIEDIETSLRRTLRTGHAPSDRVH